MEPALTAAVEPVRRVRGIKNKDINPVCSLSLSPGRSGSDLPGCLWSPTVSPETRSACSLSRTQKGPSLHRICVCAQLCRSYPASANASARTSAPTITNSQVIKACFQWQILNGILVWLVRFPSTSSLFGTVAPHLMDFKVKFVKFQRKSLGE